MRAFCLSLTYGLCLLPVAGRAFTLTPMSATLAPKGNGTVQTFRIENESSNRVAFEVKLLTRQMDEAGNETNQPAANLFTVFPPQGVIAPGKSQSLRLVWQGPANPTNELAFRLVAEELPVNFTAEKNRAQIKVVLRYMAAVYVQPRNAKPNLQVASFTRSATNTYHLILTNSGNAHQPLIDPTLTLTDAQGRRREVLADALVPVAGQNVLAGHTRRFVLTLPAEFQDASYQAQLTTHE